MLVLLTDDDNGTLLVRCADEIEAVEVAAAAVFSDGGVSAWIVPPDVDVTASAELIAALRDGENTYSIKEKVNESGVLS